MSYKLLQLSDLHLRASPSDRYRSAAIEKQLLAILVHIRQEHADADALILSGDISQDAGEPAYSRLAGYLAQLGIPWYWVPGNHDDQAALQRVWGAPVRVLDAQGWQLLLLNSTHQPDGRGSGCLGARELGWLEQRLRDINSNTPVGLVVHHNPLPTGSGWQDAIGLGDAESFWRLLKRFPAVRLVLHGHLHQAWDQQHNNVRVLCCPSTAVQFRKTTMSPETEQEPGIAEPGYRWLSLHSDGALSTGVERLQRA